MKTLILNLTLLTALVSFSGCFELDFEEFSYPSNGGYWGTNFTPVSEATFWIDSVKQISDSEVTIWSHIKYDSILIIKNRKLEYNEVSQSPITKVIQSVPDTLDFRKLPDTMIEYYWGRKNWKYVYSITVNNLKKEVDYSICILTDYSEKAESKSATQCTSYRLK